MNTSLQIPVLVIAILLAALLIYAAPVRTQPFGAAPAGVPATMASSTNVTTSAAGAVTIVGTTTCASRVITSTGDSLRLTFNDAFVPTAVYGVFQATNTTVTYDASLYGCGKIKAFSVTSNAVTFADFR